MATSVQPGAMVKKAATLSPWCTAPCREAAVLPLMVKWNAVTTWAGSQDEPGEPSVEPVAPASGTPRAVLRARSAPTAEVAMPSRAKRRERNGERDKMGVLLR